MGFKVSIFIEINKKSKKGKEEIINEKEFKENYNVSDEHNNGTAMLFYTSNISSRGDCKY